MNKYKITMQSGKEHKHESTYDIEKIVCNMIFDLKLKTLSNGDIIVTKYIESVEVMNER